MGKNKFVDVGILGASSCLVITILTGCITVQVPAETSPAASQSATPRVSTSESNQEGEDPAQSQSTNEPALQEVDFTIAGGCQDSYEAIGYYGIFEEFEDDCFLVVEVFPAGPSRKAELQYFDETWVTETSAFTDSSGIAYLEVDPYCDDGYWCDGVWEYRVLVNEIAGQSAERSITFELDFIPYN